MAEIRIEERKNNWLPWLLGILGLMLLVWLVAGLITDDDDDLNEITTVEEVDVQEADMEDVHMNENNDAYITNVSSYESDYKTYIATVDKMDEKLGAGEMDIYHEYSNKLIVSLSNALESLVIRNDMKNDAQLMQKGELMRTKARQITKDWKSTEHADMIRQAAMAASDMLMEMQNKNYISIENEVMEVKRAAEEIDPKVLTLDQKTTVKDFFRSAADALYAIRDANS